MLPFPPQVANVVSDDAKEIEHYKRYTYPSMAKTQGSFHLEIEEGGFTDSEIIVMLGQNGMCEISDDV